MTQIKRIVPVLVGLAAAIVLMMLLSSKDGVRPVAAAGPERVMPSSQVITQGVMDVLLVCTPSEPTYWSSPPQVYVTCVPTGTGLITFTGSIFIGHYLDPYAASPWEFQFTSAGHLGCFFQNSRDVHVYEYDPVSRVYHNAHNLGSAVVCTGEGAEDTHAWYPGTLGAWHFDGTALATSCPTSIDWKVMDTFKLGWGADAQHPENGKTPQFLLARAYMCNTQPQPDCGVGISNTHFYMDDWGKSNATYTYSIYSINPGGSIQKSGNFTQIGVYSVTVLVRSADLGTLLISAGGYASPVSIPPGSGYVWYTTTVNVASQTPSVVLSADASNSTAIDVHAICFNLGVQYCGVIRDYDFYDPTSWNSSGGPIWSLHEWQIIGASSIEQPVALEAGLYTVTVRAKLPFPQGATVLAISNYPDPGADITIPANATSYSTYTATIEASAAGMHNLRLSVMGGIASVTVDWICLTKGSEVTSYPCGLSAADALKNIAHHGRFEEVDGFPSTSLTIYPGLPPNTSIDIQWHIYEWYDLLGLGFGCNLRRTGYQSMYSVGIPPTSHGGGTGHVLQTPVQKFNIVFRMRPRWNNAQLNVTSSSRGTDHIVGTTGDWSDHAVFIEQDSSNYWPVEFRARCSVGGILGGDGYCTGPDSSTEARNEVLDIDDVYVIPGNYPIQCGQEVTTTSVVRTCVNPCADFDCGPDGPQMPMSGANDNTGTYDWRWANSRMGHLGTWPHAARLYASNSYIYQDIPVSQGVTDQDQAIVLNQPYSVMGDAKRIVQAGDTSDDHTVKVTVGDQVVKIIDLSNLQDSNDYNVVFTPTAGMVQNGAIRLQLENTGGASALLDWSCIMPTAAITTPTTPFSNCLGTWTTSSGGALPSYIAPGDYVKNSSSNLPAGDYQLSIEGSGGPDTLYIQYYKAGNFGSVGFLTVDGSGDFSLSVGFVVDPGGWDGGDLIVKTTNGVTIARVCLQATTFRPTPPPGPPVIVPIPECGNVNSDVPSAYTGLAQFYKLSPYSETTGVLSGTLYNDPNWGRYLAMESYNYAIYPFVCTTISVANWNVHAYNALMDLLTKANNAIQDKLDEIIALLNAILNALLNNANQDLTWLWVLLLFLLAIVLLIISVLSGIFGLFWLIFTSAVKLIVDLGNYARGVNVGPASYNINCANNANWMCYGLSSLVSFDSKFGEWVEVVVAIVVAVLTFQLVLWVVQQVRGMMQPGSQAEDHGD